MTAGTSTAARRGRGRNAALDGFLPMLAKEFREFVRTWRIWLMAATFAFFALLDPLIARFAPEILATALGDGLVIQVPDPTYLDVAVQWSGDLAQLLMFVVLGLAAGSVAGEASSGTLVMPLTKPLSRRAFVLAKVTSTVAVSAVAVVLGTAVVSGSTLLLFEEVDLGPLWRSVGAWSVLALLLLAITMAASCAFSSTIAALGVGLGGYIVLGILGLWGPARSYTPAGLPEAVGTAASGGEVPLWPVLTGILAALVALVLALAIFRRREL
nr:ABC transporter permease subunit [Actinomycetales bacterium]